uniref:Uncharacterized protein n=1 Tax=Anopheles christyi TaxID=43041 RepID=A0A182JTB4_9DIPT
MPLSGEVVQLADDGGASSFERRVLSSSVDANATKRSNPELTRSCQLDSSSPTTSSEGKKLDALIEADDDGGKKRLSSHYPREQNKYNHWPDTMVLAQSFPVHQQHIQPNYYYYYYYIQHSEDQRCCRWYRNQ